ncbi:MAG: SRPBCC family protein [Caulobacter sp.]|nr:SRPBCC family protein [Caulobacter sp.]
MGETQADANGATNIERTSDTELVVTRTFNAPARIVFKAWTTPELFKRWWSPRSLGMPILACEMDVRTGGGYRLTFGQDEASSFSFFGKYLEVIPDARLVWTNEEGDEGAVTTVTFEDRGDHCLLTYSDRYPSKAALEAERGAEDGLPEQFEQLDALLATLV